MSFKVETHIPTAPTGKGNQDFGPTLAGHDYRQPAADPRETLRIRRDKRERQAEAAALDRTAPPTVVVAAPREVYQGSEVIREGRQKGHKVAPRWNPKRWYDAPTYEQAPLAREEGETWNSRESQKVQGTLKGQDRLMRSVRRPEDVDGLESDQEPSHPLNYDREEYYPGRSLIDAAEDEPANDFQVRPVHLPDFYNPPPGDEEAVPRMQRLRELLRQRYAGRPRLIGVFRSCALQKPGFVFPRDLQQVLDQMGIKVSEKECDILIKAVDKDNKGAVTFQEFADLIYGPRVKVGGRPHDAQERHVRHMTRTLVDGLIANGQLLGKAFCELDPERRYAVNKEQFADALGTACNHISKQAVDFLWASQFPGDEDRSLDHHLVDWRSFMSQLAHFAHDHRAPTPCCVQGRKNQYDLLQRTAAITGGYISDADDGAPRQSADDDVHLVADHLVHRQSKLPHQPRDAAMLTEHYVEVLRTKATRAERALPQRIPPSRLRQLLKDRESVHQDELVDLICQEIDRPMEQTPLLAQQPLYAHAMSASKAEVLTLDPRTLGTAAAEAAAAPGSGHSNVEERRATPARNVDPFPEGFSGPACLRLVRADVEAFVATQRTNRDHEISVENFISNLYRPPDEKKIIDTVNDGLNRQLRGNRPPRERPPNQDALRYENYWQARYMMEALSDAIAAVENSNGGKIKPSRIFKRIDIDNDGYVTLSDLRTACEKYKIPNSSADLHALLSALDQHDKGSVDIGEFTRNYEVQLGSVLENMQKPIRAVVHEGGTIYGGPVQEMMDAKDQAIRDAAQAAEGLGPQPGRSSSAPPTGARSSSGSTRQSQIGRAGASIAAPATPMIYEAQVGILTGRARISDVIRARITEWKPTKAELYTSAPRTRFGMTIHPDTRHITEANMPLSASYMGDGERFKSTNTMHSLFSVPDHKDPQAEDAMRRHSKNEFRVERIRQRQRDFAERCWAANEAAQQFDELKIARKAMNLLNYERKCHQG